MRILITGASGLLRGRIFEYLKKNKIKIIIASRRIKKLKHYKFKKINWNSNQNLEKLCSKIDVIINCAGYDSHKSISKSKTFIVNSQNPFNLFKAAQKTGVSFFIFLSSAQVYKNNLVGNITENTKTRANNFYSLSKLDAERKLIKAKKKNTKLLILRPSNLFGYPVNKRAKCWHLLINSLIKDITMYGETTILSKQNTYRNYGSIESFCSFIFLTIKNFIYKKKKIPLTINYCSEYNLSITDMLKVIKERFKKFKKNTKIKIKFKNGTLKKTKKLFYRSIYSKKFKFAHDKNFIKEVDNLIFYCRSNFRSS